MTTATAEKPTCRNWKRDSVTPSNHSLAKVHRALGWDLPPHIEEAHALFEKIDRRTQPTKRKNETERMAEKERCRRVLNLIDVKYNGRLSDAPEDCPLLNEYRELVGA